MGSAISTIAGEVLPLAAEALELVASPVKALLPATEGMFQSVLPIFEKESGALPQGHPAEQLIRSLPNTKPSKKQDKQLRILELLMDEMEASA